jgi:glycosyltransferase involved in cell wall biosynthesis
MGLSIAQVATSDLSVRLLLSDQIKALEADGHRVVAVCAPGPWVESVRRAGITVETVAMEREIAPFRDFRSTAALARLFRQQKFNVVHTHTPKAGLIGPLAARLAGIPQVVHTVHGLLFHDQMTRLRQTFFWIPEKFTATLCNRLLSQSREDMERAVRSRLCSRENIFYIGNGIDVSYFAPQVEFDRTERLRELDLEASDFIVGSVGRLVREKGFIIDQREIFSMDLEGGFEHCGNGLGRHGLQLIDFVCNTSLRREWWESMEPRKCKAGSRRGMVNWSSGTQRHSKTWVID